MQTRSMPAAVAARSRPFPPVPQADDSEFVRVRNEAPAPTFLRFRHILADGMSRRSAAILPDLPLGPGDRALDVGCGVGDLSLAMARRLPPDGPVVGVGRCDAFLDLAEAEAESAGIDDVLFDLAERRRPEIEAALARAIGAQRRVGGGHPDGQLRLGDLGRESRRADGVRMRLRGSARPLPDLPGPRPDGARGSPIDGLAGPGAGKEVTPGDR